jgi:hypothetical protein
MAEASRKGVDAASAAAFYRAEQRRIVAGR